MIFYPMKVPLKVFSILFKIHWMYCVKQVEYSHIDETIFDKSIFEISKLKILKTAI